MRRFPRKLLEAGSARAASGAFSNGRVDATKFLRGVAAGTPPKSLDLI